MNRQYERALAADKRKLDAARETNAARANELDEAFDIFAQNHKPQQQQPATTKHEKRADAKRKKRLKQKQDLRDHATEWSLYLTGLPTDVPLTSIRSLFERAGEVARIKAYRDELGRPKGDGLVTFASAHACDVALKTDWSLHGQRIGASRAHFGGSDGAPLAESAHAMHAQATEAVSAGRAEPGRAEEPKMNETAAPREPVQSRDALLGGVSEQPMPLLADGTRARIRKLKSRPELNGCECVIAGYDTSTGRYTVDLSDNRIALRPRNLLPSVRVTVADSSERAGASGTVRALDEDGVYCVALDDAAGGAYEEVFLSAGDVVLPPTVGTIRGLTGSAHLNGRTACVVSHDTATDRYVVSLEERQLRLRRSNIVLGVHGFA
jgi:hypothetical protein